MGASVGCKNLAIDGVMQGATITVSLHSADPGSTGASELTGGSYARQTATFGVASGGVAQNSATITFSGLPAATITHAGVWRSGTFMFGLQLSSTRTVQAGDGLYFAVGGITVTASAT